MDLITSMAGPTFMLAAAGWSGLFGAILCRRLLLA